MVPFGLAIDELIVAAEKQLCRTGQPRSSLYCWREGYLMGIRAAKESLETREVDLSCPYCSGATHTVHPVNADGSF